MLRVALCRCPNSRAIINEKIYAFMGDGGHRIFEFDTMDEIISAGMDFDLCFLGHELRKDMGRWIEHIEKSFQTRAPKKLNFLTVIDDPISDTDCDKMIEFIKLNLGHTSMSLAIEFLTDKGLRSIALSKILYFEFYDRKVKIKSIDSEFVCNDTLRNVMALVEGHGFRQPHKSFIVNLRHIVEIKNYTVNVGGVTVPLSQKRSREFRQGYKVYLAGRKVQTPQHGSE